MAELIPGLGGINWFPIVGQFIYWTLIILVSLITLILVAILAYVLQFKLRVTEIPMFGSGTDGIFSVGKPKKNKVKWIKNRTAWRSLYPLFNKVNKEPFDDEYIYPGNRLYAFSLNNQWVPGRINITQTEEALRAEINPVPYYVRNWQSLEHKKNAEEFAKDDFWSQNKTLIMVILAVFACCTMAVLTIYFTYKFAGAGRADISAITSMMQGLAQNAQAGNAPI
jgi:flagellar basal body-associated protein FliL